jgi:hypothetical protein
MDARGFVRHDVRGIKSASVTSRETSRKDGDRRMPLRPFNVWDYLLCAVAYFLIGIAAVPKFASLLVGR